MNTSVTISIDKAHKITGQNKEAQTQKALELG